MHCYRALLQCRKYIKKYINTVHCYRAGNKNIKKNKYHALLMCTVTVQERKIYKKI